jgi:superfamily II DNA or RNA helicase
MSGETTQLPADRLQAVADWVATTVRPVLHVMAEDALGEEPQQEFETREYQLDAWARLEDARAEGRTRALGNLATGLGKTFVAAMDVIRYREWCSDQDPPMFPRVLYVSHQKDINEQAAETFRSLMPDAEVAHFETRKKQLPDADITFATIQSLYSELDRFDPHDFEYIVWDESHHLEADTYKAVRDHFDPLFEHAITATIERMDGKDIQEYFGSPLYQKTLPEGIAEGWLADVEYHIVFDSAVKNKLQGGFDPKSLREIKELFDEKPPREAIARNIEEEIERLGLEDPKTIIFCEDIDEAEEMAALLGGVAYHSKSDDRKQTLHDFRSGSLRRITTRDMLNEGVNIPGAELLVFLRGTNSPGIFEQQLGRGLRRAPGKDKVYVLDFVANVERIAKVRELSQAIQRRASEISGRDRGPKDLIPGEDSSEAGLRVHSAHGEFDFDKIAVDLLAKWGSLKKPNVDRWDSDDLTEIVQKALELSPARALTYYEIVGLSESGEFVSATAVYKRFGGMAQFQEACGFKLPKNMTNDELIELAKAHKPDGAFTTKDIGTLAGQEQFIGYAAVLNRFGSLAEFNKALGYIASDARKVTAEDMVGLALVLSPDAPMTTSQIKEFAKEQRFAGLRAVLSRFGSLAEFQRACGFEVQGRINLKGMSNDDIVALARTLKVEAALSGREIDELSRQKRFVSTPTIKARFGSLEAFQEACGFAKEDPYSTTESIVAKAMSISPERPLDTRDITKLSKSGDFVSMSAVLRRFGTIANFQKACGFDVIDPDAMTDEDIIALALRLHPDSPMKHDEISELSKAGKFVSPAVIAKRFSSMNAFQYACGFEPVRKVYRKG